MPFSKLDKKGLNACWIQEGLSSDKLSIHISEVAPGQRAHPPHTHEGIEAFYLLEGKATLEIDGETREIGPNEVVILDPRVSHGLRNTGDTPIRYMVIIAR